MADQHITEKFHKLVGIKNRQKEISRFSGLNEKHRQIYTGVGGFFQDGGVFAKLFMFLHFLDVFLNFAKEIHGVHAFSLT
jgi:hypothetical protein